MQERGSPVNGSPGEDQEGWTMMEEGKNIRYHYRIEKIFHKPEAEDIIYLVIEFKDHDLPLCRILATKAFIEETLFLKGKYSPACFNTFDTRKGTGYNFSLLLIDNLTKKMFVVESTMTAMKDAVDAQRKEEEKIFREAGFTFPQDLY